MNDIRASLSSLRRPTLLIRAARFGLAGYDRNAVLKRVFGLSVPAAGRSCVARLVEIEGEIDALRRDGDATYSIARHVEVLAAVMAESRTLPAAGEGVETKAKTLAAGRGPKLSVLAGGAQPNASAIVDLRRETYSAS